MKSLQKLIKESLENSNFISESFDFYSSLNNNIINEAKKPKKTILNMTYVFLAALYYIGDNGFEDYMNWMDSARLKNTNLKLYNELVEGGTKDSKAADELYDAIVKIYKVFKNQPDPQNMLKEIFVESLLWIRDGKGETEPMNWLEAQGGKYYNKSNEMFKMISTGGNELSKAADEFYDAIVKFYKDFNFKQ